MLQGPHNSSYYRDIAFWEVLLKYVELDEKFGSVRRMFPSKIS